MMAQPDPSQYCPICGAKKSTQSVFCLHHARAHQNLLEAFKKWRKAYGEMTWEDYLRRLKEAPGTGGWVIQMITYLEAGGGLGGN